MYSLFFVIKSDNKLIVKFLSNAAKPLFHNRSDIEENYILSNGELDLLIWKGYVLKKNKVAIYGGS